MANMAVEKSHSSLGISTDLAAVLVTSSAYLTRHLIMSFDYIIFDCRTCDLALEKHGSFVHLLCWAII